MSGRLHWAQVANMNGARFSCRPHGDDPATIAAVVRTARNCGKRVFVEVDGNEALVFYAIDEAVLPELPSLLPGAHPEPDKTCPCGALLVRDGVTVKAHWIGTVCDDCEAAMFAKHNAREVAP